MSDDDVSEWWTMATITSSRREDYYRDDGERKYHNSSEAPYFLPVDHLELQRLSTLNGLYKCFMNDKNYPPQTGVASMNVHDPTRWVEASPYNAVEVNPPRGPKSILDLVGIIN